MKYIKCLICLMFLNLGLTAQTQLQYLKSKLNSILSIAVEKNNFYYVYLPEKDTWTNRLLPLNNIYEERKSELKSFQITDVSSIANNQLEIKGSFILNKVECGYDKQGKGREDVSCKFIAIGKKILDEIEIVSIKADDACGQGWFTIYD